ncbi:MAG: suppressor of fused domain protein [Acidimicrobiales bacterium]
MEGAPGWEAIDAALARLYGDTKPHHLGTVVGWALGGADPLDGVSAYPRSDPVPHWHYISYGLTELHESESENAEHSGWGFELTFRLARSPADDEPPVWAVSLLQNLARYVSRSRNCFEPGHHMNIGGPIAADRPGTAIRAIAFVEDPELGAIATVNGRVQFLQIVGLTTDEYEAVQMWNTSAFLETVTPALPLLLTDVTRGSLLRDRSIAARVQAGGDSDGSSTGSLLVDGASWEMVGGAAVVRLGALQAPFVGRLRQARLPFGRDLVVTAGHAAIRFRPAERFVVTAEEDTVDVGVPLAGLRPLIDAIRPHAGRVTVSDVLVTVIVPTVVRDAYGNPTGEVIG